MFAAHMTSEFRVPTEGRGRKVDEWQLRPAKPDNHFWDALVGCAVGASIQGVRLPEMNTKKKKSTKKKSEKNINISVSLKKFKETQSYIERIFSRLSQCHAKGVRFGCWCLW